MKDFNQSRIDLEYGGIDPNTPTPKNGCFILAISAIIATAVVYFLIKLVL
jgi:hypothetical protein